jgi:glutathione synthase/RimK-type ligase-like ATP-grasp enzyme
MKFLISTEPDDTHAIFVRIALESMGHDVRCLFLADQPTKLKNSVFIDDETYQWKSTDKYSSMVENNYDVVWWRRARRPHLPKEMTHPEDYPFSMRENRLFYESLTHNLAPNAWWVNPKEPATRANSKLLQLKRAVECGMMIPTTLCSNDPQDIRYFILKHEEDGVIYKPLCSNYWFEEEQIRVSYTSKVSFLDLPTNKLLQMNPGIFQKEIKKKYELRITCFGDCLIAAKLNSQSHAMGRIDWRAIPVGELSIEPYTLPPQLERNIRAFMKRMGLVFGAIDMIVTEDHEYIFLEVNEQGQFLWIEEYNQDFKMLDIFIQFLLTEARPFQWDQLKVAHTMEQYSNQMVSILSQNMRRHVSLNHVKAQKEM